jgi:hypothetical protein
VALVLYVEVLLVASIGFFDREIRIATADLEPAAINAELAKFARQELAKAIADGASPQYDRFVNGREGAAEETVTAPGPIVYVFNNWPVIITTALEELRKRSPKRSGRYVNSFIVLANQVPVADFRPIPAEAEVIIFNAQPYTRRIEVGANRSTGKRHFDATKSVMSRRYGVAFRFETKFLDIRGGIDPRVPYILRGSQGRRKDRQAGMPITYPAILMNAL